MALKNGETYKTETQIKQEALARREAEARLAESAPQKSEQAKKAENFWYHYKWHSIAAVAAVLLTVFFVRDTVFRPKPDTTIVLVTELPFDSPQLDALSAKLEEFAPPKEKGEPTIEINYINFVPDNAQPLSDMAMASSMKLMAVMASGTEHIYLLDETTLAHIESMGGNEEGQEPPEIFKPESVSAEALGVEGAEGLTFYLRQGQENSKGYQYAEKLMNNLAAGQ